MEKDIIAVALGIIAIVALIGNILVVIMFLRNRKWLAKTHSCLILALAIQDIMTAICLLVLPQLVVSSDVYRLPSRPSERNLYCGIIWSGYIPFALSIVSIYTCLMLAVDRWVAVFKPLSYKHFSTSGKSIAIMVIIPWIAGFVINIKTALNGRSVLTKNGNYVCRWRDIDRSVSARTIVAFLILGKGLLPTAFLIAAYAKMVVRLKKAAWPRQEEPTGGSTASIDCRNRNETSYTALKRLTRMICLASTALIICWLPDQVYFFLFEFNLIELNDRLHEGLHVLAFTNSLLNPFIYSFSNKQYKKEFQNILKCILCRIERLASSEESTNRTLEERVKNNETCFTGV